MELKSNLTVIYSKSGDGKSFIFSALEEWAESHDEPFVCINYKDISKIQVEKFIKESRGKLIVIDNADIVLTKECRRHIALDTNNQYILMGRVVEDLLLTPTNMCRIKYSKKDNIIRVT